MINPADPKYFPKNYNESRETFRRLAEKLKGELGQLPIPSPTDPDLSVDHAYWPALDKPEFLLVLISGIHGSETYAGAAIQNMFLTEIFPSLKRQNVGVFVVHSMNPYGFKYHQRTTQNGVNLNRNFSVSGKLFQFENPESDKMHELFFERQAVSSKKSLLMKSMTVEKDQVRFSGGVTLDQFTKATAPGQFKTERNIEFGGRALEPQTQFLIEKIKSLMPQYKDTVAFDLHTGLGDKNRLHLLTSGSGLDLNDDLFKKLFDPEKDHEIYSHTPASEEGFYEVHGASNSLFADLAKPTQRICAITMEFGTLGHSLEAQLEGLNSFILTHQGHYYGYASAELKKEIEREDFERSYPQNDEWRSAVISASRGLFQRVLNRSGALSSAH